MARRNDKPKKICCREKQLWEQGKLHLHPADFHGDKKIAGLYDLQETIGSGHFAVVKLARHAFTGEKVAVKVINKQKLDSISKEHLFHEVMCMKLVQHPNIVRLYEVIDTTYQLYLILELGDGGDLYDYIMKHEDGLSELKARHIFRQIVTAISYCHQLHVVHRDLKPENVVFFEKLGLVKLTDFGFSNRFEPGEHLRTSCGSLAYSAPEILLGDPYDAPKVDLWSLGVILYMLVCGKLPFCAGTDSETLAKIMDCSYSLPAFLSKECCTLISRLLVRDPDKRASLEDVLLSDWLNDGSDAAPYESAVPLISRAHIPDEDHLSILKLMEDGNLGKAEEIQAAVEKNEYSHLTATYYLLAERKLKRFYYEKARMMNILQQQQVHLNDQSISLNVTSEVLSSPMVIQNSVRVLEKADADAPEEKLHRFSMILEDEEEEEDAEISEIACLATVRIQLINMMKLSATSEVCGFTAPASSRCGSRNSSHNFSAALSDAASSDTDSVDYKNSGYPICHQRSASLNFSKLHRQHLLRSSLPSARSNPHLLIDINEENDTSSFVLADDIFSKNAATNLDRLNKCRSNSATNSKTRRRPLTCHSSPTFWRRYHRFLSESTGGGQSRSSSDNSDTDNDLPLNLFNAAQFLKIGFKGSSGNKARSRCNSDACFDYNLNSGGSINTSNFNSPRSSQTKRAGSNSSDNQVSSASSTISHTPIPSVVGNGAPREKFTPICEEEEDYKTISPVGAANAHIDRQSSQKESIRKNQGKSFPVIESNNQLLRLRSESVDYSFSNINSSNKSGHKASDFSLSSSTPNQSNFSLSSLAGSLRGSKVAMVDALRNALDLPPRKCNTVQCHQSQVHHFPQISMNTDRCSLQSLPTGKLSSLNNVSAVNDGELGSKSCKTNFGSNNNSIHASSIVNNSDRRIKPSMKLKFSCCAIS